MATIEIIKKKRKLFHALLAKNKLLSAKEHILYGEGVESVTELSEKQLDSLIEWAGEILNQKQEDASKEIRSWRHKCLRMMRECGIETQDWNNVNAFLLDKRVAGKHLYKMSIDELKKLHRKLHNIATNKEARIQEERGQAFLN